jgi:hypothetical protein
VIRVHTSDGLTTKLDLWDEAQAQDFLRRTASPAYQASITAITAYQRANGREDIQASLARPQGFSDVRFEVEGVEPDAEQRIKGGERIVCYADDVRVTIMLHKEQAALRVSVLKAGRQRYNPKLSSMR